MSEPPWVTLQPEPGVMNETALQARILAVCGACVHAVRGTCMCTTERLDVGRTPRAPLLDLVHQTPQPWLWAQHLSVQALDHILELAEQSGIKLVLTLAGGAPTDTLA